MGATVERDGYRVWIPNVKRLPRERSGANVCQYVAALTAAAHVLGRDVSYEELMGLSGAAFKLYHQSPWCPGAVECRAGFFVEQGMRALGYKPGKVAAEGTKKDPKIAALYRQAIVSSIDRGYPVVGLGWRHGDSGLIAGYAEDGKVLFGRHCHYDAAEYAREEKIPDEGIRYIREAGDPPSRRTNILNSLELAVKLAATKWLDEHEGWLGGFAAYEAWIQDLQDQDRFQTHVRNWDKGTDGNGAKVGRQFNCYIYRAGLVPARLAAGPYLHLIQDEFAGDAAERLRRAAALYDSIGKVLFDGQQHVPGRGSSDWDSSEWRQELRLGQAAALQQAFDLEREGIAEIEQALCVAE